MSGNQTARIAHPDMRFNVTDQRTGEVTLTSVDLDTALAECARIDADAGYRLAGRADECIPEEWTT